MTNNPDDFTVGGSVDGNINNLQGDHNQQIISNETTSLNLGNADLSRGILNTGILNAEKISHDTHTYNISLIGFYQGLVKFCGSLQADSPERVAIARNRILKIVKTNVAKRLEDFLQQSSSHENLSLELKMEEVKFEVGRSKRKKTNSVPYLTEVIEGFEKGNGKLLLLGEPGVGKTIKLLQLAEDLVKIAEQDPTVPIPVIVELANWKDDNQKIDKWVITELRASYTRVEEAIWKKLLHERQLVLLMDGLDEVGALLQRECIKQLNEFIKKTDCNIFICCRYDEYRRLKIKLTELNNAYRLLPPSDNAIQSYLNKIGRYDFCKVLQSNSSMRKMAKNPLFLDMLLSTDDGKLITDEKQLIESFISHKLEEPLNQESGDKKRLYEDNQKTRAWLKHIAKHTKTNLFLIENIQSTWLEKRYQKLSYQITSYLALELVTLIAFILMANSLGAEFQDLFSEQLILIVFVMLPILFKQSLIGSGFKRRAPNTTFSFLSREKIIRGLKRSVRITIIGLIIVIPMIIIMPGLLLSAFLSEPIASQQIRENLLVDLFPRMLVGIIPFSLIGFLTGIKDVIEIRDYPNQGFWESLKSCLITTLVSWIPMTMVIEFMMNAAFGMRLVDSGLPGINYWSMITSGFIFASLDGLLMGGIFCIKHLCLRFNLWLYGLAPFNYENFLTYAVKRKFIQQVGGEYRFIHKLLQDHFAQMEFKRNVD